MSTVHEQPQLMLDPNMILAEHNIRHSLTGPTIESLKDDILEKGGVLQNVVVRPLAKPVDGKKYELVAGFRRHAAVTAANKEGAGILLPAVVRDVKDEIEAFKVQLSENKERESLSPIDTAHAIEYALNTLKIPKVEVLSMFSRPGGRKGQKMQPLSNSMCNIYLSFLDLPKGIQNKAHDGRITIGGLMQLVKIREKAVAKGEDANAALKAVEDELEADRLKEIEAEEAAEKKFLESEKKSAERQQKEEEKAKELADTKEALKASEAKVAEIEKIHKAQAVEATKLYEASQKAKGKEAKPAKEAWKAAEALATGTKKSLEEAQNEALKAQKTLAKLEGKEETKAPTKAAAAAKSSPAKQAPKPVGKTEVQTAAKKAGVETGQTQLSMKDLKSLLTAKSGMPKVDQIKKAVLDAINCEITDGQFIKALAQITGEGKAKAAN